MDIGKRLFGLKADALDFAPPMVRVQNKPASPLPRVVLHTTLVLFAILAVWVTFGRLDIIAVAQGKLVPQSGGRFDRAHRDGHRAREDSYHGGTRAVVCVRAAICRSCSQPTLASSRRCW